MIRLNKLYLLIAGIPVLALNPLSAASQSIRDGYVDWGKKGTDFPSALQKWEKGMKWSEDDNFFISRVRPKERFRNTATQVNPALDETIDKKLIFWVPINNATFNALPDGVYDSEVFPMWSYVTHYGNWSAPLVRIPGGFSDVAHKNGVAVSALASIPYGNITSSWNKALTELGETDPQKLCDFLTYYGVDGIGYNSEFTATQTLVTSLTNLHYKTLKLLKESAHNPVAEFIWYDGTNSKGQITFDRGLASHNAGIWGRSNRISSSLFFNYNWNKESTLKESVEYAEMFNRTPLDLYCGINMQGREPKYYPTIWPLLAEYPLSIGLWGAHSQNMFFESRADMGSSPERKQRTYLDRVIRWFTGGTFNPLNTPELSNSLIYSSDNNDFFGMSKMMSARSALKWNLSEEPFITYFNLGNGRFFNYKGVRSHNSEWYNIGMQDYLPTWMWWFSGKFLGRDAADVPGNGLKADYVWDDAYMGGSGIKVSGSVNDEYLHLFKTEFELNDGDVITFRYKVVNGSADVTLALSMKDAETLPVGENSMRVLNKDYVTDGMWIEKQFIVGKDLALSNGATLAMVALHFANANDIDVRLGEFSIVRPSASKADIDSPVIEKTELLASRHGFADGKIIFNMPNDKGKDICYNIDVNTSLFKLYAQQEGCTPVLMGMTPSWAGLMFSIPCNASGKQRMRLGVSAINLDWTSESDISWGEWQDVQDVYEISDDLHISQSPIAPGEEFFVEYYDPSHPSANWSIVDSEGKVIGESQNSNSIDMKDGISTPGLYDLIVEGVENHDGEIREIKRTMKGFVQISDGTVGRNPRILDTNIELLSVDRDREGNPGDDYNTARISYKADRGEGVVSRGVRVGENAIGFQWKDTDLDYSSSFSISFWYRPDDFSGNRIHMLNIRDKGDAWVKNNYGWFWHTMNEDGTSSEFSLRTLSNGTADYKFGDLRLVPGAWYHLAYVFENNGNEQVIPHLYVNGEKQKVTSWSVNGKEQTGEPTYYDDFTTDWRENNVVAFAGYAHKAGSVNGNVDNFMIWDKALDADGVKTAMSDINPDNLPKGLAGYFDFEGDVDSDGLFANKGYHNFKAGMHTYASTEVEGQANLKWISPEYCPGALYLDNRNMEITTDVTWSAPGAQIVERSDDTDGGMILLNYSNKQLNEQMKAHGYPVRLTLRNEYGEANHDFLVNLDPSGVATITNENCDIKVFPNPFDSIISVVAPKKGNYRLTLLNMDGQRLLINNFESNEGETMQIYPEVTQGLYLLTIECNGSLLSTSRLIRK